MAVSLYFGLPGCGKTTMLAKIAHDAVRKSKYEHVYTNVEIALPGVTMIQNDDIGTYDLSNSLLLIDEATLFADSRAYKSFDKNKLQFFLLHRHYNVDVCLFTQQWDGVDRKIRTITDRVYYIYKTWPTGRWISKCYRIPYGIIIPDPNKGAEKLGEIIQGYSKPPFYIRIFAKRVYRPKYYKYFDSWVAPEMDKLPPDRQTITDDYYRKPFAMRWMTGSRRILKYHRQIKRRKNFARLKSFLWRW